MLELTTKPRRAPTAHAPVLRAPRRLLQRRCACGGIPGQDGMCEACRRRGRSQDSYEREADAVADRVAGAAPPHTMAPEPLSSRARDAVAVRSGLTSGEPLPTAVRVDFERRIGRDFSDVRIHRTPSASATADELGARAFTIGSDVVFAGGEYAPDTSVGRRLLAHELAHVAQQTGPAPVGPRIQLQPRVGTCTGRGPFDCAGIRCRAASGRLGVCMWIASSRTCFCRDQSTDEPKPATRSIEDVLPGWLIALIGAAAVAALVACFASGVCEVGAIVAIVGEGLADLVILLARAAGFVVLASADAAAQDVQEAAA